VDLTITLAAAAAVSVQAWITQASAARPPVPHYRIAPRKVSPGRKFTGKNLPPGEFLPENCRPGDTFLGAIL